MTEQPDLQAVREFLEGLGYEFSPMHATIRFPDTKLWFITNNEISPIKKGLEHYLSTQLGVHWREVYKAVDNARDEWGFDYGFSESEWDNVNQAISYLEALEKGEGE
jgi:hypothetical protein